MVFTKSTSRLIVSGSQRHGGGVAGIDEEEGLDLLVLERLEVLVGELEEVLALGGDMDLLQIVVLEVRHLEIRREDRRAERDRVAGIEQALVLQRLEDVAHRRRAALDRIEVELHVRAVAGAHRPHQVFVGDRLVVDEGAVGNRVMVADDGIGQFVDEGVGFEGKLGDCEVDSGFERLRRPAGRRLRSLSHFLRRL